MGGVTTYFAYMGTQVLYESNSTATTDFVYAGAKLVAEVVQGGRETKAVTWKTSWNPELGVPTNQTRSDTAGRTAVVIPFKARGRKSRLNPALGEEGADRLARLLLEGVLGVLAREGLAKDSYVVTSDGAAASAASRLGVGVIEEGADSGVDGAVRRALGALPDRDSFLVIPSDLPLLSGGDLRAVLSAGSAGFLVLAPSAEFNGTNAMLFARGSSPELSYDRNSFWNHLGSASARGLRSFVYTGRGVVFDVDTAEDVSELALSPLNTPTVAFAKKVAAGWRS